ncbi:MAG: leucine-rich repeat domain-containing protein [Clostridiales bacterium]|nr:leucine-rich repeat domain-containing protein [Clostridiales bacterium]
MSTLDTKLDIKSSHLILPEGITHIDLWAYSQSSIVSAYLPDSLRTIGMCAFKDCKNLKEVSMPPNA